MTTTLLLALTLTTGAAQAQAPSPSAPAAAAQVDSRFNSWLGCWRLEDDLAGTGARMCITPDTGGVRLQTIVGAQKGIDELVIPDGTARPITDSECKGTERAEWSTDGLRVFRTTDVTCNNEAPRTIKSVAFLGNGPAWINVQHVSGQSANTSVRVQRYRRAANQSLADGSKAPQPAASAVRTAGDTAWGIDDVIEASTRVPAEALQAALTEVRQPFDVNSKTLIAMDDAGVSPMVIDLMVALTFPKRFVVQRPSGGGSMAGLSTGGGMFDPFMSPLMMGAMADCYTPFGYGYRSYYSMCGSFFSPYSYYPYLNGIYGNRYYGNGFYDYGGWVIVNQPTGSVAPGAAPAEGRVVNGRGYTQIRRSEPEPTVSRMGNGGNGTAGGYSGATSSGASGASSSGGYSSGGSSGGGSSSGGDSGARTAVPRPPGGN
jgi:hypothetical protein